VIHVEITNEQTCVSVDEDRLRAAIVAVVSEQACNRGTIGLAIVDDAAIQSLNRRWLDHDYATDVLSFVLEREENSIDGEIVVSGETAAASAARYDWPAEDELLLYVIHGALHLAGFDDQRPADAARMRWQEALHLTAFGLAPHDQETQIIASRAATPPAIAEGSQP
jgi:probable rRNA maturation factor